MGNLLTKGLAMVGKLLIGGFEYGVITVCNKTGVEISAGSLVRISGYDATLKCPTIVLADADSSALDAQYITSVAIGNGKRGLVFEKYEIKNLNTNAAAGVGSPVYLSITPGGWSLSAPTGADQIVQVVGYVTVKSATVGKIMFILQPQVKTKFGSSALQNISVLHNNLAGSFLKISLANGTAAATDVSLTGIIATDQLVFVGSFATKAEIATLTDRTSEYTCGAAKLVKAAGTDETNNQLLIVWLDIT